MLAPAQQVSAKAFAPQGTDEGDGVHPSPLPARHVTPQSRAQVLLCLPGGLKEESFASLIERRPEQVLERAVKGMLPKNRLGRHMGRKLKVYAGPDHPHDAQQPKPLELPIRKVDA